MNIAVCGMGKLGLPVALAIESKGHTVMGYDVSPEPYSYIEKREIPYKEEGLQPLLDETKITMVQTVEELFSADIIFLPVQTPHQARFEGATPLPDDRADFDYTYLKQAIEALADYTGILAVISTCLPGTYERELAAIPRQSRYVYTPQFIAMGTVLKDYLFPEFNLIGVEDEEAADILEGFYDTINRAPSIRTDIKTAEGIKVSYNTWITAKTVIANAWGEMCHKTGMNFDDMKRAWDESSRRLWSTRYTDAGMSDGGGCHPRDNIALSHIANEVHMSHNIWEDLMEAREDYEWWHAQVIIDKAFEYDLPIIILGRAFKPETNIETGSPARLVSAFLHQEDMEHMHTDDYVKAVAIYFIGTKHQAYADIAFEAGSVVIDPFGLIQDQEGVEVIRLGRK